MTDVPPCRSALSTWTSFLHPAFALPLSVITQARVSSTSGSQSSSPLEVGWDRTRMWVCKQHLAGVRSAHFQTPLSRPAGWRGKPGQICPACDHPLKSLLDWNLELIWAVLLCLYCPTCLPICRRLPGCGGDLGSIVDLSLCSLLM